MMAQTARLNWGPDHLVSYVSELSAGEIAGPEKNRMFLLMRITDKSAAWMSVAAGAQPPMERPTPGEPLVQLATCVVDFDEMGDDPMRWASSNTEQSKLAEATRDQHILFPIRKRGDGASFLNTITVGRTRNHDIALRDSSVSKFHASLEIRPDGAVMVRDQQSKNHTLINGKKVDSGILCPGDDVQFGSIKAMLCTAEGVWHALHPQRG